MFAERCHSQSSRKVVTLAILHLDQYVFHVLSPLEYEDSKAYGCLKTAIYKSEKTPLGTFLDKTRSILQIMAGHAEEIGKAIQLKFHNSVDTIPKGTRHITLLYHQVCTWKF